MPGVIWAALAGISFGLFQTTNRRSSLNIGSFEATFLNIFTSAVILVLAAAFTQELVYLHEVTISAIIYFGLAGFVHFTAGWTFFNFSQKAVGAARTSALLGTAPLFSVIIDVTLFQEWPSLIIVTAIVIVVLGVYLVSRQPQKQEPDLANYSWLRKEYGALFGLLAAICWSVSPIFIRSGLKTVSSPLLGVALSLSMGAMIYGVLLATKYRPSDWRQLMVKGFPYQILAGMIVGVATWIYWQALALIPTSIVLALSRLSVPVVFVLSPLIVRSKQDHPTLTNWVGGCLIVLGSLGLILLN